ncbi:hypothetical protein, variant, partial [Aphanomyces invadans]
MAGGPDGKRRTPVKAERRHSSSEEDDSSDEEDQRSRPRPRTIEEWKIVIEEEVQRTVPEALQQVVANARNQRHDLLRFALEGVTAARNLAPLAKDYVRTQGHIGHFDAKLSELHEELQAGRVPSSFDHLLKVDWYPADDDILNKHEYVKLFDAVAGIEREEDEDEDVMVQESNSLRNMSCPITQMIMQDPVKNPECGHTYSKVGIESHLKHKQSCPVAGCRKRVQNLEPDVDMEVLIANRSRTISAPTAAGATAVDSDSEEEHIVE